MIAATRGEESLEISKRSERFYWKRLGALLVVAFLLSIFNAKATSLVETPLQEKVGESQLIAHVQVEAVVSDSGSGEIFTIYQLKVLDVWKGHRLLSGSHYFCMKVPGGRHQGVSLRVVGAPQLQTQHELIVFAQPTAGGCFALFDWKKYTVAKNEAGEKFVVSSSKASFYRRSAQSHRGLVAASTTEVQSYSTFVSSIIEAQNQQN